ncbi:RHS repeat-associated core domain-containing protein [Maricaulaceae bacterium MS644]
MLTYDEYGNPGPTNTGRYQYTGQTWLADASLYHYKNRAYNPRLMRFMQADPIGHSGGMNLYAYVGGDPVNYGDPWGLSRLVNQVPHDPPPPTDCDAFGTICGKRIRLASLWEALADSIRDENRRVLRNAAYVGFDVGEVGVSNLQPRVDEGEQPFCPIDFTPHGESKGQNPRHSGYGYNTDLPGGYNDAVAVFTGLSRLAGDTSTRVSPQFGRADILMRSYPTGIQLRRSVRDGRWRIDIPANTFQLTEPETIHFTGGEGNICPT